MTQEKILEILAKKENNIYQSEIWAKLQAELGREIQKIKSKNFNALLFEIPLFKGKLCLFCSKGPVLINTRKQTRLAVGQAINSQLKDFIKELKQDIANHIIFVRIEPILDKNNKKKLKNLGFYEVSDFSPLSQQISPKKTLVLDISKSEEEIMAQMKQKARYNIRLSYRKGVKIKKSTNSADIDIFYKLLKEVSGRDSLFSSHPKEYYKKMLEILAKEKKAELFIAEFKKQPLAAILVTFTGKVTTYAHGASSSEKRELMAPYLLQWEAIKEAKKRGCMLYDFWGIAENDDPNHSWAGVTRFKKGFGGYEIEFAGSFDYPIQPFLYKSLVFANRIRKFIKRR